MQISRVSKLVEIKHGLAGLDSMHNDLRTDEPRAAGDQHHTKQLIYFNIYTLNGAKIQ